MESIILKELEEEYEKVRDLGKGTYGFVKLWKRKEGLEILADRPKYVAIKTIVHVSGEKHAKLRRRELDLLEAVQSGCHRNIIKYFGSFRDNSVTTDQTVLVMEACHSDLRKLISTERQLNDEELRMLGEQILHGLHYLHCLNATTKILHRYV